RADVHQLADLVLAAGVEDVAGPLDGAALVLEPAALHGGADVEHAAGAAHGRLDRHRIAEVAADVLDPRLGAIGHAAHHHAHLLAFGAQPGEERRAEPARG